MEIDCPDSCRHLASSRTHPAAVVRRRQERDVATLLPTISHLDERQHQLFFLFVSVIARHRPERLISLVDDDVAEATGSVAATAETAARGVVYEHVPDSPVAQRLARELTAALADLRAGGAKVYDGEAAIALRAIERGARELHLADDPTAYVSLVGRLLQLRPGARPSGVPENARPGASIILP